MSREIWREIILHIHNSPNNIDEFCSELDSLYTVSKKGESIEVRKSKFINQIGSHKSEYPREMLIDFLNYWSEISINGKKMRFEKEKVFDVKLRLARWHKNSKNGNTKNESAKIGRTTEDSIKLFIAKNSQ